MTDKKRIVFVVNPISGTQGKKAILKWIDERLDRSIYDYSIVKTEYAGHATQIAAAAVQDKVDIVVAIGGDGTINEIARSLVHTETALGIIPCGSGNGLARHLRIPMEPKAHRMHSSLMPPFPMVSPVESSRVSWTVMRRAGQLGL